MSVFLANVDVLWVFSIDGRANASASEQEAVRPQKTMAHTFWQLSRRHGNCSTHKPRRAAPVPDSLLRPSKMKLSYGYIFLRSPPLPYLREVRRLGGALAENK